MFSFIVFLIFAYATYKYLFFLLKKYHKEQSIYEKLKDKTWIKVNDNLYKTTCDNWEIIIKDKSMGDDSWTVLDLFKKDDPTPKHHTWVTWMHVYLFDRNSDFNSLRKICEEVEYSLKQKEEQIKI